MGLKYISKKMKLKTAIINAVISIELIRGFLDGLKPIERISVTEWSNTYRYLSNVASARPGLYNMGLTPYLQEIADCLSDSSTLSEVVFMKGAQIGATEVGNNWIGYIIHIAPAATLMVMPTDETVIKNSKIRIAPMINATPVLRKRINTSRSKDGGNTMKEKEFPGGVLIMTGAGSPTALRSLPIKNLMLDEIDGYEANVGKEGSPIQLAIARTNTYIESGRKIFYISTPTIDGISAIQKEYNNSDRRKYFIPCPHCGLMQTIEFDNIKWEDGKPETAKLQCKGCMDEKTGKPMLIDERYKMRMLTQGQWQATNTDFTDTKNRRGYHLSALYSSLGYKWSQAVREYLAAQGDDLKMCTFVNTVLGEVWKEAVDVPEWSALYGRRQQYKKDKLHNSIALITCGVDVQKDRLELEIVGWCNNLVSRSIRYEVIWGDTDGDKVWEELSKFIDTTFEREDGSLLPLRMTCIDSGFNTETVYKFCRKYESNKVIAIKGRGEKFHAIIGRPQQIDVQRNGKPIGSMKVWGVGDAIIKSELYGFLRQVHIDGTNEPRGYCYFPMYYDEHYFKMLVSEERRIVVNTKGYREYKWVLPSHRRNEALDCRVYARAGVNVLGVDRWNEEDWEITRTSYPKPTDKPPTQEQTKSGSPFLGGESIW